MKWWRVSWVRPENFTNLMEEWWFSTKIVNLEKQIWDASLFAIVWSIWKVRNDAVFRNFNQEWSEVCDLVKTRIAFWIKSKHSIKEYSVEDFKQSLDRVRRLRV